MEATGKMNLYGQLPGENKVLLASVNTIAEIKAEKDDYAEVFKDEGIVLTTGVNKDKK